MKVLVLSVIICWGVFGCMSLEERLSSRNQNVRTAAEYELVAKSRRSGSVAERVAALKKVKCEPLLARVALDANKENGSDVDGKIAVSRISDQELLFKIAMEGKALLDSIEQEWLLKQF